MNPRLLKKYLKELDAGELTKLSRNRIFLCFIDSYLILFYNFHAVKEFLEKCKSDFEEKWTHPKHVSLIIIFFFQCKTFLIKPRKTLKRNGPKIQK